MAVCSVATSAVSRADWRAEATAANLAASWEYQWVAHSAAETAALSAVPLVQTSAVTTVARKAESWAESWEVRMVARSAVLTAVSLAATMVELTAGCLVGYSAARRAEKKAGPKAEHSVE